MDSKVETYSGGLPKGQVKYKDNSITDRKVSTNVSNALKEVSSFPFTITSATSTEEEDKALGRESKTHLEGRAIDVRYDDQGHKLVSWITGTSEGNSWAKKHGASILPHGEGGQLHYHIQFNRQQTKTAETKPAVKPTAQQPAKPVKVSTPPFLQKPADDGYQQVLKTLGSSGNMFEISENINFPEEPKKTKPTFTVATSPPQPKTMQEGINNLSKKIGIDLTSQNIPGPVKVNTAKQAVAETKAILDKAKEENPSISLTEEFQELYSKVEEAASSLGDAASSLGNAVSSATDEALLLASNIPSWANRFFVNNLGIGDLESEAVENKAKQIKLNAPPKATTPPAKGTTISPKKEPVYVEPRQFQELGKNGYGHWRYMNKFDRNQGFEYIPIKNVGNSRATDSYQAKGIGHFLLDTDVSGHPNLDGNVSTSGDYMRQESFNYIHQTIRDKKPAGSPGSTVNDPFLPLYKKTADGKVLVTYQPLSVIDSEKPLKNTKLKQGSYNFTNNTEGWTTDDEVYQGFKIMSPLRQYRYSDINWDARTSPMFTFKSNGTKDYSFNKGNIASLPTVVSYDVKNPKTNTTEKSNATQFIFPSAKDGKAIYGKYGGGTVIFLSPKKSFAIDFTGSIDEINSMSKTIMKDYELSPQDLIIAYHDLGSFSAKPVAKNGKLNYNQWSKFNTAIFTGGALAIP